MEYANQTRLRAEQDRNHGFAWEQLPLCMGKLVGMWLVYTGKLIGLLIDASLTLGPLMKR